jgi:hypothetical protein
MEENKRLLNKNKKKLEIKYMVMVKMGNIKGRMDL